jgi:hypothetical protein
MEFVKYNTKSDSSNSTTASNGVVGGGIFGGIGTTGGDGHTHANLQVLESITQEQWSKIVQLLKVISVGNNGELMINGDVVSTGEITAFGQITQATAEV